MSEQFFMFFTKTGSKSIPRMGRRADNSLWSSMIPSHSSYNRKVMEALLDRYNEKKSTESENSMTENDDQMNTSSEFLNDFHNE
ncbi:unnamed protein product [Oppiella nova]|uniref:Uncharacterized protein n=1 Tax=Oppiella nova TaxID=334625 RepID=A0A7R9M1Y8_9ACAR|nr:unnamed protein product [Oppiella nova]CAG2169276.1 unnamed protein product [Oppiella nova]